MEVGGSKLGEKRLYRRPLQQYIYLRDDNGFYVARGQQRRRRKDERVKMHSRSRAKRTS